MSGWWRRSGIGRRTADRRAPCGRPALLPTDTVYGLCSTPGEAEVEQLYALKGRQPEQPTALLAATIEQLLGCIPEARDQQLILETLLPGPYTLVVRNPARRFGWLAGADPEALGVRVPSLPSETRRVLVAVGCIAATSANEPAGRIRGRSTTFRRGSARRVRARCRAAARNPVDGDRFHRPRAACAPGRRLTGCRGNRPRPEGASTIRVMAVAHETLDDLKTLGLAEIDPEIAELLGRELDRQRGQIELIASENFTWPSVFEAVGSVPTNKYAEGYPGKRYYGGCEVVDEIEEIARNRATELFGAEHANVQAHAGAQANMTVYFAVLKPGDRVLGLSLDHGGHLTHGLKVNFSGKLYEFHHYGVSRETMLVDYDELLEQAKEVRPG